MEGVAWRLDERLVFMTTLGVVLAVGDAQRLPPEGNEGASIAECAAIADGPTLTPRSSAVVPTAEGARGDSKRSTRGLAPWPVRPAWAMSRR